jgi:hypothetical protein
VNLSAGVRDQLPGCEADASPLEPLEKPMSRKLIVAIAAVAALGMSTLVSTDAFARGGGHFGGSGGHVSGGHGGFSRGAAFHGRTTATRTVSRNVTRNVHRTTNKHAGKPNYKRPNHHPHRHHYARHHHRHHYWWCRHHPYRCGGTWGEYGVVDGGVAPIPVAAAPVVAAAPAAAVCTNDCDYFLKDEPGCYMAKRAFSTPVGDELRCVKICDEGDGKRAEIK